VLLLSSYLDARYAATLFETQPAGSGYLLKERVGDPGALSDALRRLAHGECVLDPAIVSRLMNRAREPGPLDELSSARAGGAGADGRRATPTTGSASCASSARRRSRATCGASS
jgi:DNA-binding NarL/FixJ family response regulator